MQQAVHGGGQQAVTAHAEADAQVEAAAQAEADAQVEAAAKAEADAQVEAAARIGRVNRRGWVRRGAFICPVSFRAVENIRERLEQRARAVAELAAPAEAAAPTQVTPAAPALLSESDILRQCIVGKTVHLLAIIYITGYVCY